MNTNNKVCAAAVASAYSYTKSILSCIFKDKTESYITAQHFNKKCFNIFWWWWRKNFTQHFNVFANREHIYLWWPPKIEVSFWIWSQRQTSFSVISQEQHCKMMLWITFNFKDLYLTKNKSSTANLCTGYAD